MTQYIVHIYREMRLIYEGIEAESPEAAAAIARDKPTDDADGLEDCNGTDLSGLVDVVGDQDYSQSVAIDFASERLRKVAPKLLASLEAILPYAEHEAYGLERHEHDPEAEAEAKRAWKAIESAWAAVREASTAGGARAPAGIDVGALLAPRRQIAEIWGVLDVRAVRPDLTDDQAWYVLRSVSRHYDPAIGITWDVLRRRAEVAFGAHPAVDDTQEG